MRMILFVILISISAGLFLWNQNRPATGPSPFDQTSANSGQATGLLAMIKTKMGGSSPDQAGAAASDVDLKINGTSIPVVDGIPDSAAMRTAIDDNLRAFGGVSSISGTNRPKDFSARFVKVPAGN